MPPVPKVILARPGRTQPWPTSDACWSPAMPQIGGAPSSATAAGPWPDDSMTSGRLASGIRSASSSSVLHVRPSEVRSPVSAALVGSVTWADPPLRCQAIQLSTVPTQRSRVRSGSARSSRCCALVAETLGARWKPCSRSTRHWPIVRRSCQPMPGPTGSPVLRSQTMVEARWLAMPTASTGPPLARPARAASSAARAIAAASNSTKPGLRRGRQHLAVVDVGDGGVRSHDRGAHAAGADVHDEDRHLGSWVRGGRRDGGGRGRRRACRCRQRAGAVKRIPTEVDVTVAADGDEHADDLHDRVGGEGRGGRVLQRVRDRDRGRRRSRRTRSPAGSGGTSRRRGRPTRSRRRGC